VPERFAVMLHHGLGDVICALPALWEADRQLGSAGQFDVVVKSPLEAGVIASVPWRGTFRAHCLPGGAGLKRVASTFGAVAALRRRRPQAFLAVHVSSPRLAALMALLVGAPSSIVPAADGKPRAGRIESRHGEHKAVRYARFFAAAGVPVDLGALRFPNLAEHSGPQEGAPRIVLAPAVGAPAEQHKRWPPQAFAALADRIVRRWPGSRIELFASPGERAVLDAVAAAMQSETRAATDFLTPATPVLGASSLVGAACVVTSCSGASHLAAWAGVPIVGTYGPTNPGYTGPFSDRLYVVRNALPCSPCYRPGFISGCGTPICMTGIEPDEVLRSVADALAGVPPRRVPVLITTTARASLAPSTEGRA
jgi:ADP-heptose:LPS heptosyltransferase